MRDEQAAASRQRLSLATQRSLVLFTLPGGMPQPSLPKEELHFMASVDTTPFAFKFLSFACSITEALSVSALLRPHPHSSPTLPVSPVFSHFSALESNEKRQAAPRWSNLP